MSKSKNEAPEGFKKPSNKSVKWGEPGDYILGTLIEETEMESKYGNGLVPIFRLLSEKGEFHITDENGESTGEKVEVEEGEEYSVFGRSGGIITDDMERASIGQRVWIKFTGKKKSGSSGKMYKTFEVKLGPMNEEWLNENDKGESTPF